MSIDYSRQLGKKLTTKGHQKRCVDIADIVYIQCERDLATLFLSDESKVKELKSLKAFEEELCDMGFIRISKNTVINEKYITKVYSSGGKRVVYLEKEIVLNVSKKRLGVLHKALF